jgi:anti-sigma B factor antagonist
MLSPRMDLPLIVTQIDAVTVVEFHTPSLMDPPLLERLGQAVYRLVDEEDRRLLVLDFARVQFLSSQAIGIVMSLKKRLDKLPHSALVLCGVGPQLMQLIKITRLDRVMTIKSTQAEAVKVPIP